MSSFLQRFWAPSQLVRFLNIFSNICPLVAILPKFPLGEKCPSSSFPLILVKAELLGLLLVRILRTAADRAVAKLSLPEEGRG